MTSAALRIALSATMVLLGGCVQGPDYRRPEMDKTTGQRFKHDSGKSDGDRIHVPDEWWKLYQIPELDGLVAEVLAGNRDLKAAHARIEAARAVTQSHQAGRFPQIDVGGTVAKQRFSASSFGANFPSTGYDLDDLLSRDTYRSSLDFRYEVDLWGRVKRKVEAARANDLAAEDEMAALRLSLAAEVCRHYLLLLSLDQQIDIFGQTVSLCNGQVELQENREKSGLGSEGEVNLARTARDLVVADSLAARKQRENTENAIAILCGRAPSEFNAPTSGTPPVPPSFDVPVPSALLESRPDIRAAEQRLRAASATIGVAEADLLPSFVLLGGGGFESVNSRDFLDWQNRLFSFGPSVNVPLFRGGRLKAGVRASRNQYEEARAIYQQTVLEALRQVEDALLDLKFLALSKQSVASATANTRATAQLARLRHERGLAAYQEVLDAERSALSSRLLQARTEGQFLIATVHLAKALGGGWDPNMRNVLTADGGAPARRAEHRYF
jgi:multidrug efflux system outer membrane protein